MIRTNLLKLKSDWRDDAECKNKDPDIFFPEDGGGVIRAQAICHRCPVRPDCLEFALAGNIDSGVWGGKSERQRRGLRRARERGIELEP